MEAHPMETHEPARHTMASAKHVVLINRPIEVVFGSLATLRNVPRWSSTPGDEAGAEGFEITGYEPPRRLTLAGHIRRFEALVDYALDEMAVGTLVKGRVQVDLTDLFLKGDVRVATSRIEEALSSSLERSKQLLESTSRLRGDAPHRSEMEE